MKEAKVAIVSLFFYDEKRYIDEAAASIAAQSYPRENLVWVIVDNSCHGGSATYTKEAILPRSGKDLPEVVFLENDTNIGFGAGNNQGMHWAMDHGYDFVFLLNNDAKFDAFAIEEALRLAQTDPAIGAVQSMILLWKEPEQVNTSGNLINFLGFGITRDYGKRRTDISVRDGEDIGYASGAAVLYRTDWLKRVGLFHEWLWMYHEDLELSWRMRLAGARIILAASSIVYHDYEFRRSTKKMYWMERNRWFVHLTHLTDRSLVFVLPAMLLLEPLVFLGALTHGWVAPKLRSYAAFCTPSLWRELVRVRRHIQSIRVVSDHEATATWVGPLEHQLTEQWIMKHILNPTFTFVWRFIHQRLR